MRKSMFTVPAVLAVCLACSGGTRRPSSPPTAPPVADNSLREVLLGLSKQKSRLGRLIRRGSA